MTNGELKQRIAIVRKRLDEGKEPKVSSGFMLALLAALEAVPVDAINDMWAMTPYCEMTDTATLDTVKAWLETVRP